LANPPSGSDRWGCFGVGFLIALVLVGILLAIEAFFSDPAHGPMTDPAPSPTPEHSVAAGTWTGTASYRMTTSTSEGGGGTTNDTTTSYEVNVRVWSTAIEIGAWEILGEARITSDYSNRFRSSVEGPFGPCVSVFSDTNHAEDTKDVSGGLEARDGFYNLSIRVPEIEGISNTVRDDTGCNGSRLEEQFPWPVGPILIGGGDEMTDPNEISWENTAPVPGADGAAGGEETMTWTLRFTP